MARTIKGITVEIGGDTTKLGKALEDTNKQLTDTQKELGAVNRLLKLDPSNVELLTQKQRYLTTAVSGTGDKLEKLKSVAEEAKKKLDLGEIAQGDYDYLQREIIKTADSLEKLEKQAGEAGKALEDAGEDAKLSAESFDKIQAGASKVSTAVAGIAAAAFAAVPATQEFREDMGKLATNIARSTVSMDTAREAFRRFNAVSGETDSSVEALSNLLASGLSDIGLQTAVENLAGAVVTFPDTLKIESLADSLQETIKTGQATGQFAELLGRMGVNVEELSESLALYTNESDRANIALSALASTGLSDAYTAWQEQNGELIANRNATLAMQEALARLASQLEPVVTKITNATASLVGWFAELNGPGKAAVAVLLALGLAIGPLLSLVGKLSVVIKSADVLFTPLNLKIAATVGGMLLLAAAVAAVAAAWQDMSGMERLISVLGVAAIAAGTLAVAMGAITGPVGAALAAAAIVGGIATVAGAVGSANRRAAQTVSAPSGGAGYAAAPQHSGGYAAAPQRSSGNQNITLQLDGATLGRAMMPYIDGENARRGVTIGGVG